MFHRQGAAGEGAGDHGLTERVAITWLPYELNPDMPGEGMDRTAYLDAKFGAGKRKEIEIRLSEAALESGVTFNWARVTKSVNTRMAHMIWSPPPRPCSAAPR